MNILRWLARGLLLTLTTVAVTAWITTMVLQSTLLNRQVVLGWLDKSGAYDHIIDSIISLQNVGQDTGSLDQESLKQAVTATLTPSFVKQVSETTINSVYDWLEGKSENITFTIPVSDKRAELQQQLQAIIAPQLKNLPTCKSGFSGLSSTQADCLPQGGNAEQVAMNAAKQTIEGSDFLTQPITQDLIDPSGLQNMKWLPMVVQSLGMLSMALPVVALLSGTGYVFLSTRRMAGIRTIAGHLVFGTGIAAVVGLLLWYFGSTVQIDQASADPDQIALIRDVIQPIIYQVAPAIGFSLALFAGSVAVLCAVVWITMFILGRKKGQTSAETSLEPERHHELPRPQMPVRAHTAELHTEPTTAEPTTSRSDTPKPPAATVGRM